MLKNIGVYKGNELHTYWRVKMVEEILVQNIENMH